MATKEVYVDKKNSGKQSYTRRDSDGTEGGTVLQEDSVSVATELNLDSGDQFRHIVEENGEIVTEARTVLQDVIPLAEVVGLQTKPPDDTSAVGEEFSGSFGFGGGNFGQGGFGGTLP